ncbi:hypothetical protein [Bacteroides uniformis]|uniref:hypothetical protein n=1 Tax=Bacteroides uniformis TaxID=820 RepID=UPI001923E0C5|nr:hypothetical protein [Bacteroides uniformis]
MEGKDIRYTGVTQAVSDMECSDGDLSISHNVINHNGAMRPIIMPDPDFSMGNGEKLVYIHVTPNFKNFIYLYSDEVRAFKFVNGERVDYGMICTVDSGSDITDIRSIGNTLMLITSAGIKYVLLKDNAYVYLGEKMPDISMSFGLSGFKKESSEFTVDMSMNDLDGSSISVPYYVLPEKVSAQMDEQIRAKINTFVNEETLSGRFTSAFLVRYAYNTINGYTMQSPPVLMIPNSGRFPYLPCPEMDVHSVVKSAKTKVVAYSCVLDYRADSSMIEKMGDWEDVISSVDIFVSQPISRLTNSVSWGVCDSTETVFPAYIAASEGGYIRTQENGTYGYTGNLQDFRVPAITAPILGAEEFAEKIKNEGVFWKVKSIAVGDLKSFDYINVDGEILQNIGTQESLEDGYNSYDKITGNSSFVYNNRLNIANIKRYPHPFSMKALQSYTDSPTSGGDEKTYGYKVTVFIRGAEGVTRVESGYSYIYSVLWWIYYPNPDAFRMVIERKDGDTAMYADLTLTEHSYLNGSYYYNAGGPPFTSVVPSVPADALEYIIEPNKIYTSEVNNPFVFPLAGINAVGVGQIIGISSITRALSQGQFGQFPLLVFATDGIWAMEVSGTGLYSVKQPISRDVCINSKSITQIDNAVLFVSEKGVMFVDGSNVNLISAELDGPSLDMGSLDKMDAILQKEGFSQVLGGLMAAKDFFRECRIGYDYPNARLFFFREDKTYAYVYSLNARAWGTVSSTYKNVVVDYPNSYIQQTDNNVVNLSEKNDFDSDKETKVFMLSRPMKLGDDVYKTVNMVINRGYIRKNSGAIVVFASFDGLKYFPIGSVIGTRLSRLQGSPYRYFRILTIGNMTMKEAVSFTSVYYTLKWRNKPR